MSELATAYVQLVPTATGMQGKIAKELGGEANAAGAQVGESMGVSLGGAFKKVVVALGLGKIVKDALTAGGDLQQSFGGLDTIYGNAAESAKKYSAEAVKAGISANTYAEQAVSFGASLKQAYGGDTYKAMEAANTAILDMADNSAKMGTDINSIQNAYQGFAKQNYTMLDNLKLGYGGTKGEMERLLADAEKLSGVKYNIDNLGDVYDAIHVIQGDLGLTGVAAAEAEGTFTGSFASMKAAAQNLLANLALGEDIQPSLEVLERSVRGFLTNNLFPMVGNLLKATPDLVDGILSMAQGLLNTFEQQIGAWTTEGITLVGQLAQGILSHLPYLAETAIKIGMEIIDALLTYDWIGGAKSFITEFSDNMGLAADEIFGTDGAGVIDAIISGITNTISNLLSQASVIIQEFSGAISQALPGILSAGVSILTEVTNGILKSLPQLITSAGQVIITLSDALLSQLPTILDAGVQLLLNITQGILDNLPQITSAAAKVMMQMELTLIKHYPEILQKGVELLGKLAAGIIKAYPQVIRAIFELMKQLASEVKKVDWLELGGNIVKGIGKGIKNAGGEIWNALRSVVGDAWDRVKDYLQIGSPSKLFENSIGRMIPQGMAIGIEEDADYVTKAMHDIAVESVDASQSVPYIGTAQTEGTTASVTMTNNFTINGVDKDARELAEEISYYLALEQQKVAGVFA